MKVILYSSQTSPRLSYIIDFFSSLVSDEAIIITSDIHDIKYADAVKINYSAARITENELWIKPAELLFEKNISLQPIECFEWNESKAFYKTEGDIPFDIFAASFYLITRYEEYLPHAKDECGRFAYTESLAFRENFLHLPLINRWAKELQKLLYKNFSAFQLFSFSTFKFLPTYDIDIAYSYLHKPLINNLAGFVNELFTGKWKQLAERVSVLTRKKKDPFDTYEWLDKLDIQHKLHPVYFFLLAEKRMAFDKNISPHNKALQKLIKQHAKKYATGIHPSWQSGDDTAILGKEIFLLENLISQPIKRSRQHYIRMTLPYTYRSLIGYGIQQDYSMGYGSINGFRASVAAPFFWYDLENDEHTTLSVYPFCYMDANSFFEQYYNAEQAAEELQQYHNLVKNAGGMLVTIFHNHFVTEQPQWIAWRNMYAAFLNKNFG